MRLLGRRATAARSAFIATVASVSPGAWRKEYQKGKNCRM